MAAAYFFSDHIVVAAVLALAVDQILQRDAREIILDHTVQALPERESRAIRAARAGVDLAVQTGHGGKTSLGQAQNVPRGVVLRPAGQPVAALIAAVREQEAGTAERRNDLLEVFFGDILPLGNVLERYAAVSLMLRKVEHQAQRVASLGRDTHRLTFRFLCFFSIIPYTL